MRPLKHLLAGIATAGLASAALAQAPASAPAGADPANPFASAIRGEVVRTIDEVLSRRPDVIADAVFRDRENNRRERALLAGLALRTVQAEGSLEGNPAVSGPASGRSLILIETLECAPCRAIHAELAARSQQGWRVTVKVLPIGRENGALGSAALSTQAASERWRDLHRELHAVEGELDIQKLGAAASRAGVDVQQLTAELQGPVAQIAASRDILISGALGVRQVPLVSIDGNRVMEAPSVEELRRVLDAPPASANSGQAGEASAAAQTAPAAAAAPSPAPATAPAATPAPSQPRQPAPARAPASR